MRECWCPVCCRVTEHLGHDPWRWERLEGLAPALPAAGEIEWGCDEHWDDPRLFVKVRGRSTRPLLEMLPRVVAPAGAIEFRWFEGQADPKD